MLYNENEQCVDLAALYMDTRVASHSKRDVCVSCRFCDFPL